MYVVLSCSCLENISRREKIDGSFQLTIAIFRAFEESFVYLPDAFSFVIKNWWLSFDVIAVSCRGRVVGIFFLYSAGAASNTHNNVSQPEIEYKFYKMDQRRLTETNEAKNHIRTNCTSVARCTTSWKQKKINCGLFSFPLNSGLLSRSPASTFYLLRLAFSRRPKFHSAEAK